MDEFQATVDRERDMRQMASMILLCGEDECRDVKGYAAKLRALIDGLIEAKRARGLGPAERRLTLYRDDSTVQVVFENVKTFFWTANNTVLVISQYTDRRTGAHRYIHWPRERFCWFKDDKGG